MTSLGETLRNHPLRASLSQEMHVRKLPRLETPCRLLQVVTMLGEHGAPASLAYVERLYGEHQPPLPAKAKHAVFEVAGLTLVWERHTEFASYIFLLPGPFDAPFEPSAFDAIASVLREAPGQVIRATQVALVTGDPSPDLLADNFAADGLVACEVAGGRARIWSDFQLHDDGFGRLLIADHGLSGDESSQLVQRLQELGNYRNMALLGLPVAQRLTPEVTRLEQRLATLTSRVAEPTSEDSKMLDELTFLSAELARLLAETRYRMSATRAYAQIAEDRLESVAVSPLRGYQTLADFTERRLTPALRTCDTFSQRLEDLSQRAAWTSSLLRTRIDTALAHQNRDLLDSMDRRTRLQLRLQQAVEGLSVVAISYYLLALLAYVVKAIPGIAHDAVIAVLAPAVVVTVALVTHRLRRRLRE